MERRLAAILAADVVGYSRLMRQDEGGTLERLTALRREVLSPLISQHRGRIVKLMGDGLLVEFASVVDGLSCAVAWQARVAEREAEVEEKERLTFRIGVNLGDVIVEEEDIHGDGVNVAARLEALAEPGGICVSRTVYNHVKGKVDLSFEDLGAREVKNISEPIQVYRVLLDSSLSDPGAGVLQMRKPVLRWPLLAGGLAVLVALAGVALWQYPRLALDEPASTSNMAFPLPDRPSIAVLPFNNMSDDASQEYFADGMTEDLITDLSKISGLFVIARNSSFAYKGQQVNVREVAEELGVRYVLEGSVRRSGDEVRINAQLIDAISGGHLWAERYDGTLENVFDLQDQVTGSIVASLAVSLSAVGHAEKAETTKVEAYDAFLKGWSHFQRGKPADLVEALQFFDLAASLDPAYARAAAARAAVFERAIANNRLGATTLWTQVLGVNTDAAILLMEKALEIALRAPQPLALQVASGRSTFKGRHDEAILEAERAIALNPNDAEGHKAQARAQLFAGNPERAISETELAMRLDPHQQADYLFWRGLALFGGGDFEAATTNLEAANESNQDDERILIALAASYGHLGKTEQAEASIAAANKLRLERQESVEENGLRAGVDILLVGDYSLEDLDWWPFRLDEDRDRLREGLRLAGVPETGALQDVSPLSVAGASTIDADEAWELHKQGTVFVDVRGLASWRTGHVPGAFNLDLKTEFNEESLEALVAKNAGVVIYCSGPRCLMSSEATRLAVSWGFGRVHYFREGFPAWKAAGLPIETSEN